MSGNINKDKNRKGYIPGINVERAYRIRDRLKCNEDTSIRGEIHGIIKSKLQEGKDNEYIISQLTKNERYSKYSIYFENWVKDMKKKIISKEEREK